MAAAHIVQTARPKMMCCKKMNAGKPTPQKCPKEKGDCAKECFNCPLFYVSTLAQNVVITDPSFTPGKAWLFFKMDMLWKYDSKAWKPPILSSVA